MSTATLNKWGNSAAVRLPTSALKAARLRLGDRIRVEVEDGVIVLRPEAKTPEYRLEDLVSRITRRNRHSAVDDGGPIGRERW